MFNSNNITSAFLAPPQSSTPICTPTTTTMEITSHTHHLDSLDHDFLILAQQSNFDETTNTFVSHNPFISSYGKTSADDDHSFWEVPRSSSCTPHSMQPNYDDEGFVNTVDTNKIAFRTKSAIETMDDGYKWRKYGKKMIKDSPNPRNYYRCSSGGCEVKKRVEREREDPRFVITTYEGKHNHEIPSPFNYSSTFLPHTLQILHQP